MGSFNFSMNKARRLPLLALMLCVLLTGTHAAKYKTVLDKADNKVIFKKMVAAAKDIKDAHVAYFSEWNVSAHSQPGEDHIEYFAWLLHHQNYLDHIEHAETTIEEQVEAFLQAVVPHIEGTNDMKELTAIEKEAYHFMELVDRHMKEEMEEWAHEYRTWNGDLMGWEDSFGKGDFALYNMWKLIAKKTAKRENQLAPPQEQDETPNAKDRENWKRGEQEIRPEDDVVRKEPEAEKDTRAHPQGHTGDYDASKATTTHTITKPHNAPSSSKGGSGLYIFLGFLIVAGGGAGVFYYIRNKGTEKFKIGGGGESLLPTSNVPIGGDGLRRR